MIGMSWYEYPVMPCLCFTYILHRQESKVLMAIGLVVLSRMTMKTILLELWMCAMPQVRHSWSSEANSILTSFLVHVTFLRDQNVRSKRKQSTLATKFSPKFLDSKVGQTTDLQTCQTFASASHAKHSHQPAMRKGCFCLGAFELRTNLPFNVGYIYIPLLNFWE